MDTFIPGQELTRKTIFWSICIPCSIPPNSQKYLQIEDNQTKKRNDDGKKQIQILFVNLKIKRNKYVSNNFDLDPTKL